MAEHDDQRLIDSYRKVATSTSILAVTSVFVPVPTDVTDKMVGQPLLADCSTSSIKAAADRSKMTQRHQPSSKLYKDKPEHRTKIGLLVRH